MGQRHNRRRTRPRSRNQITNESQVTLSSPTFQPLASPLLVPSSTWSSPFISSDSPPASYITPVCISPGSPAPANLAPIWHYGYTAWQIRDNVPQTNGGLEAEQCRLFGGEPGDDLSLCYRMLEYFGGLDYIDSTRKSTLGD